MRWVNRLATAAILLAVVTVPPLLATLWLAHHPWRWPSRTQVDSWLQQPLTAGTIVACCGAVATMAWLVLVIYLGRRAVRWAATVWRRLRRMPLPTPAQVTASSMAGVAAFTLPGAASADTGVARPAVAQQLPEPRAADGGITLPGGGWIPYPTAAAVTAAGSLIWFHRRRHYRPGPPRADGHTSDPDLQRLPPAAEAIAVSGPPPQASVPLAAPPSGVLALAGPGAAAAARGLLVSAALTTTNSTPTHDVRVDATDIDALLPGIDPDLRQAMTVRPFPGSPAGSVTVLTFDATVAASARWHVATDGMIIGADAAAPRRVCVLDQQTATDLIDLVRHTRDDAAAPNQLVDHRPGVAHTVVTGKPDAPGRLELLGGCQLVVQGQPTRLRRSAGLQILAYLAVHADGASPAELIRACWPGVRPASITQRLHTTISDLRKQLQPELGSNPVNRHDTRYQLNTAAIDTDLWQWRTAVAAAGCAIETAARIQACHAVVRRYTGEFAAGQDWPWLTPVREALRRDVIDAYVVLVEHEPPPGAVRLLQTAITIAPDNEDLQLRAAEALRRTGDHDGANSLLASFRRRVARTTNTPGQP